MKTLFTCKGTATLLFLMVLACPGYAFPDLIAETDSIEIKQLYDAIRTYRTSKPDTARLLAYRALALSTKNGYDHERARSMNHLGVIHRNLGNYDSARVYYQGSMNISEQLSDTHGVARAMHNLGIIARRQTDLAAALTYTLESHRLFRSIGEDKYLTHSLNSIANILMAQEEFSRAIEYYREVLSVYSKADSKPGILRSRYNLGVAFFKENRSDSALHYFEAALPVGLELDNRSTTAAIYKNLGDLHQEKNESDIALRFFTRALDLQQELGDKNNRIYTHQSIGDLYSNKEQWERAYPYYAHALMLSKEVGAGNLILQSYLRLIEYHKQNDEFGPAVELLEAHKSLRDSLYDIAMQQKLQEAQLAFNMQLKEEQHLFLARENDLIQERIHEQKLAIAFRNASLLLLIILLVTALVLVVIYRRKNKDGLLLLKQAEALNRRRLTDLIKTRDQVRMDAFIRGKEKERKRIAGDLHDSISNRLVTAKLFADNLNRTSSDSNTIRISDLLEKACAEVREVAHHLSDDQSKTIGLLEGIEEILGLISDSGTMVTNVSVFGNPERLDLKTELIAFRAVQELINNVVRHAYASEITVNVTILNEELNVMVQDDGHGFSGSPEKGTGIRNLTSSIKTYDGTIYVDSTPGKGTTVNFTLPVNPVPSPIPELYE
ncbi:MAG: tetratricopeptide repeat protein [Bacteroidota bacterium]